MLTFTSRRSISPMCARCNPERSDGTSATSCDRYFRWNGGIAETRRMFARQFGHEPRLDAKGQSVDSQGPPGGQ
jgi:hypothetical protein